MDMTPPTLSGSVSISEEDGKIIIAGDPAGLKSLAEMLDWLGSINQKIINGISNGDRAHIHLSPGTHVSYDSSEIEICRLDAKGTGKFPKSYNPA